MARQLSVFVDESGDFGPYQSHSPYYLVTMVFHNQSNDIQSAIRTTDEHLGLIGFPNHAIHTGPIIRREEFYRDCSIEVRKSLLGSLMSFFRHVAIWHITLCIEKRGCDAVKLSEKLSTSVSQFVNEQLPCLQSFDEVIIYYDNGQIELQRLLETTFKKTLKNVTFRKVKPSEYKLFQIADMICSLELSSLKFRNNDPSASELLFFGNYKKFKKDYFSKLARKRVG